MSGVAITRVKLSKLYTSPVPVPPLPEQHRIVARVDQLMTLCDELEAGLSKSRLDGEKLMAAVVEELSSKKNAKPAETATRSPESSDAGGGEPETSKHKSNNPAADILSCMQPGEEYTRADIVDVLGLSVPSWNSGIRELKEQGFVVRTGEKGGARYCRSDRSINDKRVSDEC